LCRALTELDFVRDPKEKQVQAILLTKAARWAYEREWRIIDEVRGCGLRAFDPGIPSGVVFGCRMSEADRECIREWVAAGPTKPEFFEARVLPSSYSLEIVPDKAPMGRFSWIACHPWT
jgi:hypothetical protein